jgi:glycogen debranching enzyme
MAMSDHAAARRREARSRERILTQPSPAKVRRSTDSVVLKSGGLFFLSQENGDVPFALPHGYGLFFRDCRFLDGYTLRVNEAEPVTLSGIGVRGFETHHHLTNPEFEDLSGRAVPKNTLEIRRQRIVRSDVVHELLSIRNYGAASVRLRVELAVRSRFQDVFVVKGFVTGPRGRVEPPEVVGPSRLLLAYQGRDDVRRQTELVFAPPPTQLSAEGARFEFALDPDAVHELAVTIAPSGAAGAASGSDAAHPRTSSDVLKHWLERREETWLARSASVRSSNPLFERVFHRALLDLGMLRSGLEGEQYFAAGIPWFVTLFGRDAATVALQTLAYGPGMARQTLRLLARHQAREYDTYRDAAPGKILHEFRVGELARIDAIPQSPAYYGTIDATPLFLILLTEYVAWSGDLALARELRPSIDAALGWMAKDADSDGDGYLDYVGEFENGLVNQGWKDSGNAIVNADGSLAKPPIALAEVQSYAFRAWRQTAQLLRGLGEPAVADDLERRAAGLQSRFERDFWDEDLSCYVLARQAGGRAAAVVSSNAGQVLWGGIAQPDRAARVAERLLAADMFSGWGIRTLSSQAAAYNPMSYHLGSVWPHDNALILAGFRRYGHDEPALRVFNAVFDAASNFRGYRLPELYCGHDRNESEDRPIRYPVACSPQAWAAGALPHGLWNLLGLQPDALQGRLVVRRPCLPAWLEWVELDGVRVGDARVDLRFERRDRTGQLDVETSVREGTLDVRHEAA